MKEYVFTSDNLDGEMIFKYKGGCLTAFEITGALTVGQVSWLSKNLPFDETNMSVLKKLKGGNLIEKKIEITFDIFYERYNVKSNKVRAKRFWNKLPEPQKVKAYYYIETYKSGLSNGIQPKYPDTYLNNEIWND